MHLNKDYRLQQQTVFDFFKNIMKRMSLELKLINHSKVPHQTFFLPILKSVSHSLLFFHPPTMYIENK